MYSGFVKPDPALLSCVLFFHTGCANKSDGSSAIVCCEGSAHNTVKVCALPFSSVLRTQCTAQCRSYTVQKHMLVVLQSKLCYIKHKLITLKIKIKKSTF